MKRIYEILRHVADYKTTISEGNGNRAQLGLNVFISPERGNEIADFLRDYTRQLLNSNQTD